MEAAIALLDVDAYGQNVLARNLRALIKRHRYQPTKPYLDSIVYVPGGVAYAAVAILVLNDKNFRERHDKSAAIAEKVFSDPRPERCVVIGTNSENPVHPYNFIVVFDRSDFQAETLPPPMG